MAALVAALWALLVQLYRHGLGMWLDKGLGHLLRYLLAVARITYLQNRKERRFCFQHPERHDDIVSNGAICAPEEWAQECPRHAKHLEKLEDSLLLYGVNCDGDRLVLNVSRLKNRVAHLWLALYTDADGARYSLPATFTLDRSEGACFAAAGLRLQCLAPNRRWRVAFNGLLRKHEKSGSASSVESEVHVKFGFIWSTVSHTLEQPAETASSLLAESLARMPMVDMLCEIDRFITEMDSYDQAGMMTGQVTLEDRAREVHLWGYKVRTRGCVVDRPHVEDHHFGFLEDGNFFHLVHSNAYGGRNGVYFGSLYAPSSIMRPIDYSLVRTDDVAVAVRARLYIGSGPVCVPVLANYHVPSLVFASEDASCEVHVTEADLECEENKGRGFAVTLKRHGPTTYRIADHFKHKLVQEFQVPDTPPLVSDIRDACSKRPELTGGKGSSLAVLQSIASQLRTFSVPRGFVVTTASYKILASSEEFQVLVQQIERSRVRDDSASVLKDVCNKVVAAIEKLIIPAEVEDEIFRCLSKFEADTRFAVRSSALGEDSEDMSAAGQMTTLLGVRAAKKVAEAVMKCWASQFSFTNVNYKKQYGQLLNVPMAVVIQEMVDASAAGVMFTCDAVSGNPEFITVTANYGLGESVVSASAEPDTFVLKKTGTVRPFIESKQLGHKSVYTTVSEGDGVVMLPVAEGRSQAACMSDEEVETLAYIGTQIEKTYTTPQDIEWAICEGKFFMLQCRPVTTFFRESDCEMMHEFDNGLKSEKEVLSKANMSEVLPGATSPLSLSFIRVAFDAYCRELGTKLALMYSPDPTQYVPLWMLQQRYNYFLWMTDGTRSAGQAATLLDKAVMFSTLGRDASDEVNAGVQRTRFSDKTKLPLQIYHALKLLFTVDKGLEKVASNATNLRLSVDGMTTATQMYNYLGCNLHHLREPTSIQVGAFASSSIYNLIILQVLGTANGELNMQVFSELSKILLGGDVESAEVPRMIQELGSLLRESPDKTHFLNMSVEEASEWLSTAENECGEAFREFIKKHGHRTVKEFDVYTKPWSLDPSSLVKSLKTAASAPETDKRPPSTPWDPSKLPYKLTTLQRLILKLVIPKARGAVAARETAKSAVVRTIHQMRLVCQQLAQRMVREGRLPSADLLFFLTFEEIGLLLNSRAAELVLRAQRRQRIYAEIDKDTYPSVFVGIPKPITRAKKYVKGDFEIKGNPMSQGVVEGKARVAPTFDEAHLIQKGEILVTTATDTGWTPYFPLLAGVVTEIGGPLSHGAVVAREYGLPCIVGIEGITTMIATGDFLQLDGNTGVLRKISLPPIHDD
ncbi:putative phosphoenolpyruvate synthase isoform X1 [Dermacentor silvarum]|uniref:putative phosphoenolpyruvate synthase isoform X1 n=1 Tax=Dermacentor silvarum TaxID=543639 RepID=UPI002101478E|nr:putative phosphoenolpyruvate synthase isoform X1 [Dermacentor silvarum]